MPKYRIETDNGTYEVETGEPGKMELSDYPPMSDEVRNEPGLIDTSMQVATDAPFLAAGAGGQAIQDRGEELGMSPGVAKGAGMAMKAAPYAAMAAKIGPELVKGGISASKGIYGRLKGIAEKLNGPSVQEAKDELRALVSSFEKPAQTKATEVARRGGMEIEEKIGTLKERATEIPETFRQKRQMAMDLKQGTQKEMGKVEEEMGVGFKSSPEFEAFVSDKGKMGQFLGKAASLAKKGPERLAKEVPATTVQLYRKIAQEGKGKLSEMGGAQLEGYRETFAQSLEQVSGKFKDVRARLNDVRKTLDNLPKAERLAKEGARRQLLRAQDELKTHNREMQMLKDAAAKADGQELRDLKRKALVKVRQAAQKERIVKTLKYAILGATGLAGLKTIL